MTNHSLFMEINLTNVLYGRVTVLDTLDKPSYPSNLNGEGDISFVAWLVRVFIGS